MSVPSAGNLLRAPLESFRAMHCDVGSFTKEVEKLVSDEHMLRNRIPSLNELPVERVPLGSLVRFRCAVVDTPNHEHYQRQLAMVHAETGERKDVVFRWVDHVEGLEQWREAPLDQQTAPAERFGTRQVYVCSDVRGETGWVKESFAATDGKHTAAESPTPSGGTGSKRKRVGGGMDVAQPEAALESPERSSTKEPKHSGMDVSPHDATRSGDFKSSSSSSSSSFSASHNGLRALKEGPGGQTVLVKVYQEAETDGGLKIGDICEFVGVLGLQQEFSPAEIEDSPFLAPGEVPTVSAAPRLHVITFRRLATQSFPLSLESLQDKAAQLDVERVRGELKAFLLLLSGGNDACAELLLLHMCSRVIGRGGLEPRGNLALNVLCKTQSQGVAARVLDFYRDVLPSVVDISVMEHMHKARLMYPRRNDETLRLESGVLQISDGTLLVLEDGDAVGQQKDLVGTANLAALKRVIREQVLEYDYGRYVANGAFPVDVPVVVFSKLPGSVLPYDVRVLLDDTKVDEAVLEGARASVSQNQLEQWRAFILSVRNCDVNLDGKQGMLDTVSKDLTALPPLFPGSPSEHVFSNVVTVARLCAASHGEACLTKARWNEVKELVPNLKMFTTPAK